MRLKDKVAIVTGGGKGNGRAIALRLAREGAHVVVGDIDEELARHVVGELEELGGRALAVKVDVADWCQVSDMAQASLQWFGHLDILVNNAGIHPTAAPLVELEEKDWDRILAVNLKGMFLCCKAVVPQMIKQKSGRVINISSVSGKYANPNATAYNASKAGVIGLTQTLCYELAPYNINVNAVCPGPVETDLLHNIWTQRAAKLGVPLETMRENIRAAIPQGRFTTSEDVANVVAFLASSDADHITGEAIMVSGGLLTVPFGRPKVK